VTTPEPPIPQPTGAPAPLADWGTRALGAIIDWLPIAILNAVLFRATFFNALAGLVGIAYWAYIGHLDGLTGQSPGKAIMGIRLVNERGELIGSGTGIGRKFAHIVDSLVCLLGWLLPLVDAKRQTIADKLLQTYVVSGVEKKQFAVELWMPRQQSSAS
jgi:uncharacterized RDD family membrane protein YckC